MKAQRSACSWSRASGHDFRDVRIHTDAKAAESVRGVFFRLGMTPSSDPQLDCVKAIIDLFVGEKKTAHAFQRILKNETTLSPVHGVRLE